MTLTYGSMFAGIGGLDIGVEAATGATCLWQLDTAGAAVRRRHWPAAQQVEQDVRTVDPASLPEVDILCAGFPCQDLSTAGSGKGLAGARSGLYREVLRFVDALVPGMIVIENVPALLSKHKARVEDDFWALGYRSVTWVKARASDVGAPHRRARVFVIITGRDRAHSGWGGGLRGRRSLVCSLVEREHTRTLRDWPTPTAGDAKASGSRSLASSKAHAGTSLTDALRPDRSTAEREWATPCKRDHKTGQLPSREGGEALSVQAGGGNRLNPDWVETLMGLPTGWTNTEGPGLRESIEDILQEDPNLGWNRWPRGRYPADWDRAQPWPGYAWEPARTIPDSAGRQYGRPARLRAIGNAVVWQQAAAAITLALE